MKKKDIVVPIVEMSFDELAEADRELVEKAKAMTYNSYAPYSNFKVGAAILLSNGDIVTGANQENAAFPSSTCAERSACYYAHAQHPDQKFEKIAIAARGTDDRFLADPIPPCGACRQALLEYEKLAGHGVEVILVASDRVYVLPSVSSLLPLSFSEF